MVDHPDGSDDAATLRSSYSTHDRSRTATSRGRGPAGVEVSWTGGADHHQPVPTTGPRTRVAGHQRTRSSGVVGSDSPEQWQRRLRDLQSLVGFVESLLIGRTCDFALVGVSADGVVRCRLAGEALFPAAAMPAHLEQIIKGRFPWVTGVVVCVDYTEVVADAPGPAPEVPGLVVCDVVEPYEPGPTAAGT